MEELTEQEKSELIKLFNTNKKFHYMYTDKCKQDVQYYMSFGKNKELAKQAFNILEFVMKCWNKKDVPEWFNMNDLKKLKKQVLSM